MTYLKFVIFTFTHDSYFVVVTVPGKKNGKTTDLSCRRKPSLRTEDIDLATDLSPYPSSSVPTHLCVSVPPRPPRQ